MIEIFGLLWFASHLEDTTHSDSGNTSQAPSTDETWKDRAKTLLDIRATSPNDCWEKMYQKDVYARARVMKATRLLLPHLKPGELVLDVGCYTQEAHKYLPYDIKYQGLDVEKFHKDTVVVDLNQGFEPRPAEGIICLETLEHLVNPSLTIKSILESLAPEGVCIVSLPNEATIFHRIRALSGTPDAECFAPRGKHLHLPSLNQARLFLGQYFHIESEIYYIAPSGCGSRQEWIGRLLKLVPDCVHQWLADSWPSLFARGFIFKLQKRVKPPQENPLGVDEVKVGI